MRRVLRRGSKKGLSRRHLEGRSTPFREYGPLGVCPREMLPRVLPEIGVLRGVPPRVLRELGSAPKSAPKGAQCGALTGRAPSGALPGAPPTSLSTLGGTPRSTQISESNLGSTSQSTHGFPTLARL